MSWQNVLDILRFWEKGDPGYVMSQYEFSYENIQNTELIDWDWDIDEPSQVTGAIHTLYHSPSNSAIDLLEAAGLPPILWTPHKVWIIDVGGVYGKNSQEL